MNLITIEKQAKPENELLKWNTTMEVLWFNLPYFLDLIITLRYQKKILKNCFDAIEQQVEYLLKKKTTNKEE